LAIFHASPKSFYDIVAALAINLRIGGNYPTYPLTNCEILLNCEFSYENQLAHSARSPYQL
jgi:hypothetical protein